MTAERDINSTLNNHAPPPKQRKIKCRSYKNVDDEAFSEAVGVIPFQTAYVFDDVDDIYWAHEVLFTDVLNENAPVKENMLEPKYALLLILNCVKHLIRKQCFLTNIKNGVELCRMQLTCLQMLHLLTSFFRSRLRCAYSS